MAVVLVFRNVDDLKECIDSIYEKITNIKIVVVNSFYDEESRMKIERVAVDNNCDFLNIENKGYSYGNNRGIEFIRKHYDYDYIIISNPDITISKFDESVLDQYSIYDIISPRIIAASGRDQNPMGVVRNRLSEKLEYLGYKHNVKWLLMTGIGINKAIRAVMIALYRQNKPYSIYEAHGSFVVFSKDAIEKLYPVYDENLFLFAEEGVLALRAKEKSIHTGQFNSIIIHHKEDGSMKMSELSINDEMRKANMYYYEHYVKK